MANRSPSGDGSIRRWQNAGGQGFSVSRVDAG